MDERRDEITTVAAAFSHTRFLATKPLLLLPQFTNTPHHTNTRNEGAMDSVWLRTGQLEQVLVGGGGKEVDGWWG